MSKNKKWKSKVERVDIPGVFCPKCGRESLRMLIGPVLPARCGRCGYQYLLTSDRVSGAVIISEDDVSPATREGDGWLVHLKRGDVFARRDNDGSIEIESRHEQGLRHVLKFGPHGRITSYTDWACEWVLAYEVPPVCPCGSPKTWWMDIGGSEHERMLQHAIELKKMLVPEKNPSGRLSSYLSGYPGKISLCEDCHKTTLYRMKFADCVDHDAVLISLRAIHVLLENKGISDIYDNAVKDAVNAPLFHYEGT